MAEKTDAERLERIRELLRILFAPGPVDGSPIRLEVWNDVQWSNEQRAAYEELRSEAGIDDALRERQRS